MPVEVRIKDRSGKVYARNHEGKQQHASGYVEAYRRVVPTGNRIAIWFAHHITPVFIVSFCPSDTTSGRRRRLSPNTPALPSNGSRPVSTGCTKGADRTGE